MNPTTDTIIELRNITKRFGKLAANDCVNLKIKRGTIHGIVGENGAGKSTLMNILSGIYVPDEGGILINDNEEVISSPLHAKSLGIGMVHQHFMLIDSFTVHENIILGDEITSGMNFLDEKSSKQKLQSLIEQFSFKLDCDSLVSELSVSEQQKTEILKSLYRNSSILILDEPTAVLAPAESTELFKFLRKLKTEGITIIFISHKLKEVLELCDEITVMRKGKIGSTCNSSDTNEQELAKHIIGEDSQQENIVRQESYKEILLDVKNLSASNDLKITKVKNVSFKLFSGEILGIAGIEGSGQTELLETITGIRKPDEGVINRPTPSPSPKERGEKNELDIAYIPADRLKEGVVNEFSLTDNVLLGRQDEKIFSNGIFVNHPSLKKSTEEIVETFNVYPQDSGMMMSNLSGGNQQKVVAGRELTKNSSIIIANHPTRGLDIKASAFINSLLLKARNERKGIIYVSSELTEMLAMCDRIAVMFHGTIVKILNATSTNENEIGKYMLGLTE